VSKTIRPVRESACSQLAVGSLSVEYPKRLYFHGCPLRRTWIASWVEKLARIQVCGGFRSPGTVVFLSRPRDEP